MEHIGHAPELWRKLEQDYIATIDDRVLFLDPILKEPLEAGKVPLGFYKSPVLAQGVEYIKNAGSEGRLSVDLILSYHGRPQDFYDAAEQYGERLERAAVVAIEATADGMHPGDKTPSIVLSSDDQRRSFQTAQLRWLTKQPRLIIPAEYAAEDELSDKMRVLWNIYETATKNQEGLDDEWRNKIRAASTGAYQAVRQWTLLANCGAWLAKLDRAGELPKNYFQLPFMLGSWHILSLNRLQQALCVPTTASIVRHTENPPGYDEYSLVFLNMLAKARATQRDLAAPMPW